MSAAEAAAWTAVSGAQALRRGLRDLRLVPAALGAWGSAWGLCALPGAAPAAHWVAATGWTLAALLAAAGVLRAGARRPGAPPGSSPSIVSAHASSGARRHRERGGGRIAAVAAITAAAAAAPATVLAVVGPTAGEWNDLPEWATLLEPLRAAFREATARLPGDGGALLTGLAIGDDSRAGPALVAAMRTTTLTHLTAVSGANCAMVVGAVTAASAMLGVGRRARIVLALVVLLLFVMLVTPQPSVVRAAAMAVAALLGSALSRPGGGIPLLCVAVVAVLVAAPAAAAEWGFALSALATGGLLVVAGPLGALLARWLPRPLAVALAVPIAASIGVQPLLAVLQPGLPLYGIVANVLAEPAVPLATVLGMLVCLLAPIAPPLALGIAWLGWLPSAWIAAVATTLARLPAATLPWPPGGWGVALHLAVGAAVAVLALARGRPRLGALLALGSIAIGFAATLGTGAAVTRAGRPEDWTVAMCDVGQGDAAIVRSRMPDGRWAVAGIDTGPDPGRLAACWAELGVTRLDLLVLSHYDADHVGGTDAVLGRVGTALVGPWDAASKARWVDPLAAAGARIVSARRGLHGTLGGLDWEVLWPRPEPATPEPGNAASVVIRFASPGADAASSVFLGDLGAESQLMLLGAGAGGRIDVPKAAHHGSADTSPELAARLAPRIALIGVGAGNDYGHPTAKALDALRGLGAAVGRTDTEGLLLVAGAGDGLRLWRERDVDPFAPDGPAP